MSTINLLEPPFANETLLFYKINESQEIVGMLRSQEKRNMFSPANRPEIGEYQFMDIEQMASAMGTQPVLVDQIFGELSFACLTERTWAC